MRSIVRFATLLLCGCATQADVLVYRYADSSGSPYNLDEYYVKDTTKGPHAYRAAPEVWMRAEAFCAKRGTPAIQQEQERPPNGTYVFRCIPRADQAIAR